MNDARHIRKEIALWVIRLNCDNPIERAQVQQEFQAWQKNHPQYLPYFEEFRDFDLEMQSLSHQQNLHGETVEQTFHGRIAHQHGGIGFFAGGGRGLRSGGNQGGFLRGRGAAKRKSDRGGQAGRAADSHKLSVRAQRPAVSSSVNVWPARSHTVSGFAREILNLLQFGMFVRNLPSNRPARPSPGCLRTSSGGTRRCGTFTGMR